MARSSRRRGEKMPGVSTKMSCAVPSMAMPRTSVARGLHLGRDDRDLGADQRVDQRRFADIRRADQRDEAAASVRVRPAQPSRRAGFDALAGQHRGGGGLLGGALGAADAFGGRKGGKLHGDAEFRIVVGPERATSR